MPTYQYACTACGQPHEQVQSFTDAPLTECPACGGRLRKVFSAVGVVFKGSGFYKTDSRTAAAGGKADKNGEKSGDKSGDDKAPKSDKPGTDKSSDKTPAPAKSGDKAPAAAGSGRTGGSKESSRPSSTSSTP